MIGIIDYRMGNLRSVQKAFEHVGAAASILTGPDELKQADRLVLPGVGAFGDGMTHLLEGGWVQPISAFIDSGKPFLGICLGMQLLFDQSEETNEDHDEPVAGLAILPGRVVRFAPQTVQNRPLKVPHMGWNTIAWDRQDPLLGGLAGGEAVYFVHSYYVEVDPKTAPRVVSATTEYGHRFCASLWHENIWATQFHPEKSQKVGLQILRNFTSL